MGYEGEHSTTIAWRVVAFATRPMQQKGARVSKRVGEAYAGEQPATA